jgi:hypothetical protein
VTTEKKEIISVSELKEYLFLLPPRDHVSPQKTRAQKFLATIVSPPKSINVYGYESEMLEKFDEEFREDIWNLILSDNPLSLCSSNAKGLLLKKKNGSLRQIKDNKSFVTRIFNATYICYFLLIEPPFCCLSFISNYR